MFFSFQLALPKTSVLLLCQNNSRFLTFFILLFSFAVCYLWHIALCSLEVYSFFYSMLFHSLSFWGSTRSFSISVCFNSRFLTFFILLFSFALCYLGILLFALWKFTRFFYSMLYHSLSLGGSLRFSQCLFVSTAIFLPFYIAFFLCF